MADIGTQTPRRHQPSVFRSTRIDGDTRRVVRRLYRRLAASPVAFELEGERHAVEIDCGEGHAAPPAAMADPVPWTGDDGADLIDVRLVELAWARSGDKGDLSNIGLVARRRSLNE